MSEETHMKVGIHVGFHKTASTFLQEAFFSKMPRINFIGNSSTHYCADLQKLVYASFSEWDKGTLLRQNLREGSCNFISDEELGGGALWVGGGGLAIDERTAHRLKEVFPEARILVVIREQFSMLKSLYWQYVWERGVLGFNAFLRRTLNDNTFLNCRHLCYDTHIQLYAELFGKENVLILPYESLKLDASRFVSDISAFFGLPQYQPEYMYHNPSRKGALAFAYLRFLNVILPEEMVGVNRVREFKKALRMLLPIMDVFPLKAKFRIDTAVRSELSGIFGNSNQITEGYMDYSLGKLGYTL